jgi:hypothetical protein
MSNLLYIALVYYFSYSYGLCPIRPKEVKKRAVSSLSSAIALLKLKVSLIMKKKGDK